MKQHKRSLSLAMLAAAGISVGSFQSPSHARTIMPSAGRTLAVADSGCFWLSFSAMTNGCSTAKRLETPLPIDAAGWVTVGVNAVGAGPANNVGCEAVAVNDASTLFWAYGVRWLPAFGAAQRIATTTYVPGGGGLYVYCDVSPGGRINTINY
jgi:hypothetical protein